MGIVEKMAMQFGYEGREAEMLSELVQAFEAAKQSPAESPDAVPAEGKRSKGSK